MILAVRKNVWWCCLLFHILLIMSKLHILILKLSLITLALVIFGNIHPLLIFFYSKRWVYIYQNRNMSVIRLICPLIISHWSNCNRTKIRESKLTKSPAITHRDQSIYWYELDILINIFQSCSPTTNRRK